MSGNKDFQSYDRAMRKTPGSRISRRQVPRNCKECELYHPTWKYRSCFYVRCLYQQKESTLREKPLGYDPFSPKEVRPNGV